MVLLDAAVVLGNQRILPLVRALSGKEIMIRMLTFLISFIPHTWK